jgi:proline iminopeptidase
MMMLQLKYITLKMIVLLSVGFLLFTSSVVHGETPTVQVATTDGVQYVTLENGYKVWTKRVGTGIPILTLHGGPGATHEYLKILGDILPSQGFQVIFYDQLGSGLSDKPTDVSLWKLDRFVEEVEQVRRALKLENFYLFGHSWGGLLAIEYSLKYQSHLRGLIISNMAASVPSYIASLERIKKQLPRDVQETLAYYEKRGEYHNPEYEKVMFNKVYTMNMCRVDPWPEFLEKALDDTNEQVYETMQGPNEFVVIGNLKDWDRWKDLSKITVPTVVLGARYDTMDPRDILMMGRMLPNGQAYIADRGSHLAMYDDSQAYFYFLLAFLQRVEFNSALKK